MSEQPVSVAARGGGPTKGHTRGPYMIRTRLGPLALFCVLLVAFVQAGTLAQTASAPQAAPAPSPKGTLSSPHAYIDGSFGFSLVFPVEAEFEREKRIVSPTELTIVRFVHLAHVWSLAVHLITEERPVAPADMLEKTAAQLARETEGFKVIRSEAVAIGSLEGARFAGSFQSDDHEWLRQQAFIRKSPREYYALILVTPLPDQPIAVAAFEEIVASFRILRSELQQQRLDAALKSSVDFKIQVADDPAKMKALGLQDNYLRYIEDGKEIGFRHTLQKPGHITGRPGILIKEWAWMFREDQSITQIQQAQFISLDLAYSEWDYRTRVFTPKTEGKPHSLFGIEMGLLNEGMLLVNYTPTFNAASLKEKAIINVDPSFGSPAWYAILPQLLDLKKPELYAFSAYDSNRRGMVLRTYEVNGPKRIFLDGRQLEAFRIRDCEGLLPPFNEIDVDATGRILRAKSGEVELIATTEKYVEQTYGERVKKALDILAKHPVTPPALPRPESPPLK